MSREREEEYVRNQIERYLHLRSKLEKVVKAVKNKKINIKTAYKTGIPENWLRDKLLSIKKEREYFYLKRKFEAAVNSIISKEKSLGDAVSYFGLSRKKLETEIIEFNQSTKKMYEYDKYPRSKYFTLAEERFLLKQLEEEEENYFVSTKLPCKCQACVIHRLRILAYEYAQLNKIKIIRKSIRSESNRQMNFDWLMRFEMRHTKEISKFKAECTETLFKLSSSEQRSSSSFNNDSKQSNIPQRIHNIADVSLSITQYFSQFSPLV